MVAIEYARLYQNKLWFNSVRHVYYSEDSY